MVPDRRITKDGTPACRCQGCDGPSTCACCRGSYVLEEGAWRPWKFDPDDYPVVEQPSAAMTDAHTVNPGRWQHPAEVENERLRAALTEARAYLANVGDGGCLPGTGNIVGWPVALIARLDAALAGEE